MRLVVLLLLLLALLSVRCSADDEVPEESSGLDGSEVEDSSEGSEIGNEGSESGSEDEEEEDEGETVCNCGEKYHNATPELLSCELNEEEHTCNIIYACAHEEEEDPPYVILFIIFTFALGILVRYFFAFPPLNMLPYTIVLFMMGILIGVICRAIGGEAKKFVGISTISPHLIFFIFLPIIIFESAFSMDWHVFKKPLRHCIMLAGPGILLATGLTALLAKLFFTTWGFGTYDWSWVACILYGAIVSATDPVAVVALLKELGAPDTIAMLIEGESLLNDGTAIVLFNILKDSVAGGEYTLTAAETVKEFAWVAGGGPILGLIIGIAGEWCLSKVFNDDMIEISVTIVCAYVTFFFAEGFLHVSGVLALVVLGVWLSHHRQAISPEVEHTLHAFWGVTVHLTNTLIFVLIGVIASSGRFDSIDGTDIGYAFISYLIINVVRAVLLGSFFVPLNKMSVWQLDKGNAVLAWWGGLRGAVGLALTLLVEHDTKIRCELGDLGTKFLFHVVGLVFLTLVINGITCQFLVGYLKLADASDTTKRLVNRCYKDMITNQHNSISSLKLNHALTDVNWQLVNKYTHDEMKSPFAGDVALISEEADPQESARLAYLKLLKSDVWEQYEHGFIINDTIPRVLKFIETAKDIPGRMITVSLLDKYWNDTLRIRVAGGVALSLPLCGYKLSEMTTKYKESRWSSGFDVGECLVHAHDEVAHKIDGLISDVRQANIIKAHCKIFRSECLTQLQEMANEKVEIAVGIQTRHAARRVLNSARGSVEDMVKHGVLDGPDAAPLIRLVEKRMNKLVKAPSHMPAMSPEQTDVKWLRSVDFACAQEFRSSGRFSTPHKRERLVSRDTMFAGVHIIVNGVAKARLSTGKSVLYGSGDCIGASNLLCDAPILTEVAADTDMKVLWVTADVVRSLTRKYPAFNQAVWQCAAHEAAFVTLHAREPFCEWPAEQLKAFCESGSLLSGDANAADASRSSVLPAGMHHILICGKIAVGKSEYEGLQVLPEVSDNVRVMLHLDAKVLSINDPTSNQANARKLWSKIRSRIRQVARNALGAGGGATVLRAMMLQEFSARNAVSMAFSVNGNGNGNGYNPLNMYDSDSPALSGKWSAAGPPVHRTASNGNASTQSMGKPHEEPLLANDFNDEAMIAM
ncbi:Sodium/hydrogen exchanger 7 [Diplonema papillatum]|nr:Sodium/hydrogen exchanger 7 [Diplonema papillatum]